MSSFKEKLFHLINVDESDFEEVKSSSLKKCDSLYRTLNRNRQGQERT